MSTRRDFAMELLGYERLPDEPDQPERYTSTRQVDGEEVDLLVSRTIPIAAWFGIAQVGHVMVAHTEPQESPTSAAKALRLRLDKAEVARG